MNFIVDAQLPKSLSLLLIQKGYNSVHTLDLPDRNATKDSQIIDISEEEERIVVTKDNDFNESYLLFGKPKKLLLVTTGNIRNTELLALFDNNIEHISGLLIRNSFIEISKTDIIVHS